MKLEPSCWQLPSSSVEDTKMCLSSAVRNFQGELLCNSSVFDPLVTCHSSTQNEKCMFYYNWPLCQLKIRIAIWRKRPWKRQLADSAWNLILFFKLAIFFTIISTICEITFTWYQEAVKGLASPGFALFKIYFSFISFTHHVASFLVIVHMSDLKDKRNVK